MQASHTDFGIKPHRIRQLNTKHPAQNPARDSSAAKTARMHTKAIGSADAFIINEDVNALAEKMSPIV